MQAKADPERRYYEAKAENEDVTRQLEVALNHKARNDLFAEKSERKKRTRRLIYRGALFESLVPNSETLTKDQIYTLMRIALNSANAQTYLDNALYSKPS